MNYFKCEDIIYLVHNPKRVCVTESDCYDELFRENKEQSAQELLEEY